VRIEYILKEGNKGSEQMTTALYENITKKLKLEKGTYSWAKDYFSAWHRSKVGLLDDAIESYSDGVPRAVFDKHLVDEAETIAKSTTMRELLLHIAKIAETEGFV
jgi:hypothetical protein